VKYRGSTHGTNEYPFLIDEQGFSVLPVTSLGLEHPVSEERISSGIERLDAMLGGKGFYRGSSILVSGTAGTGKTSIACTMVDAACRRGERCLYFAFEESRNQIMRNMRTIGLDLEAHVKKDLLRFYMARPTVYGLEMHLAQMHKRIEEYAPEVVVVDPTTNFLSVGTPEEIKSMMMRLVDFLKMQQITAVFTTLTPGHGTLEETEVGISSLIDTWLLVRDIEVGGERNRGLYILKSRGMAHSNQVREFVVTERGIRLVDVYLGPEGVVTGSARLALEAKRRAASAERKDAVARVEDELARKRKQMEAKMALLRAEYEGEEARLKKDLKEAKSREENVEEEETAMARSRKADVNGMEPRSGKGRGSA
jgi:circadian clock protein KaiC